MIKNILAIILSYFLVLFQTSFMVHFSLWGMVPNMVLLLVVLWNFFEKSSEKSGLYFALLSGFLTDIFSTRIIGFNIVIFLAIAVILKFLLRQHVRIPFIEKN